MTFGRFNMPVLCLLLVGSSHQRYATLVGGGGIGGENIMPEAVASVDRGGGGDTELSKDGDVDILGIQTPAHGD